MRRCRVLLFLLLSVMLYGGTTISLKTTTWEMFYEPSGANATPLLSNSVTGALEFTFPQASQMSSKTSMIAEMRPAKKSAPDDFVGYLLIHPRRR